MLPANSMNKDKKSGAKVPFFSLETSCKTVLQTPLCNLYYYLTNPMKKAEHKWFRFSTFY